MNPFLHSISSHDPYQYPQVDAVTKRQFRSDNPERRQWQDPEQILSSIGTESGMVFIDLGCGDGYFALPAARKVGPLGKVYAGDIDSSAIERLRAQAEKEGLDNIFTDVKAAEKTIVCEGCADIVFFGINLHDFEDPAAVTSGMQEKCCALPASLWTWTGRINPCHLVLPPASVFL